MDADADVVQPKTLHARTTLVWRGRDMPDLRNKTKATGIGRFAILTGWESAETRGDFGKPKAPCALANWQLFLLRRAFQRGLGHAADR